jgi:DNA-binding LacI/PurR family transcriptional regulator
MTRRVSVKDVARSANVSLGTVSNYLNGTKTVSDAARQQIEEAINHLGYRRNQIASSLRTQRTKALGMIIPSIANPFYTSVFEGAEAEAQRLGYTLALGVTHYDSRVLGDYVEAYRGRQMDGIIIDAYNTYFGEDVLSPSDGPVVVIEPPAGTRNHCTIRIDNFSAAREAVSYLIERGHKRIAIVAPSTTDDRYLGYRAAIEAAGLAVDPNLVHAFAPGPTVAAAGNQRVLIEQGEAATRVLLQRGSFTALFVSLDIFAVGALKVLREAGRRVPEDVAVVGFDDIAVASVVSPALTTVAQPHNEMGRLAVQTLIEQLKQTGRREPAHHVLGHRLVIRDSA